MMVIEAGVETGEALAVKVAFVDPAGTITLEGNVSSAEPLESTMVAPPDGAGPLSETVPVVVAPPAQRLRRQIRAGLGYF